MPKEKLIKKKATVGGYNVSKIVDKIDMRQTEHKQIMYRVRWSNSWEPEENIPKDIKNDAVDVDVDVDVESMKVSCDDEVTWEVYKIADSHFHKGKWMYYVQWKDTWIWEEELDRPDLVRLYEKEVQRGLRAMVKDCSGRPPNAKRKRSSEEEITAIVRTEPNTHKVKLEISKEKTHICNEPLKTVVEDKKIERILELGFYFNERMFLFKRLNGEHGLIPTKLANIMYPDDVMDFYELHLVLPEVDAQ